ncbi:MAG: hypothetical protein D6698_13885 [Gammaproteobacteria bacterium]|nr:MAG: hypothetical protein D6698_13885 [Gammaproteobacteria bacterium]
MNNKLNRKLGVFGPRNSGKTTYWACLYGSKGSADGSVSFTDEQTREQLYALWRSLYSGAVAPATAQGKPRDIKFSLHSDATTWCVSTKDYSGSLVELPRHGRVDAEASRDLRHDITSWIQDCDALLVLAPADLADQESVRKFRRAMEALLEAFRGSDHPGPLPVCLAVTKSDLLPMEPATSSTPLAAKSPPVLPEWLDELATLVRHQIGENHTRVFLTSAFGGHAREDTARPPEAGPQPRGLEEPLRWILAESDRCLSAPVIAKARRSLERRWFHGYRKAIKACDRVAAKGLPEKERQELDELKAQLIERRQRQRRTKFILCAFITILLVIAGLWLHAGRLATNAEAVMSADSITPESIASVLAFVKSTNPACKIVFADELERAKTFYEDRANDCVVRTENMLSEYADSPELHWRERVERAEARIKACRDFADLFPQRIERYEFDQKASDDQNLVEALQAYGPFDDEYANVVQSLESASVSQARELVRSFTLNFPPDEYPLRTDEFQRLDSVVDSKEKDEELARLVAWEARIRADYLKDPLLRSKHLEEIEKWLGACQSRGIQGMESLESGLKDLRREISEDWDRESYRKLKNAADRMYESADKLKEAIQYGEEYLQAYRDVIAMKEYVRNWLLYARALQTTSRVSLQCTKINLKNTKFHDFGKEMVNVVMETKQNSNSGWEILTETGWKKSDGENTSDGEVTFDIAPDHATLVLQVASLKLEITEYDYLSRNEKGSSDECSFLKLLEKYQKENMDEANCVIDVDGAKVTVVISNLPKRSNLPPYENQK